MALVPFFLLSAWHWSGGPGMQASDYAQYLLHARSLHEGRAYTDIGYIFTKWNALHAPRAQPPGLPVLLWVAQAPAHMVPARLGLLLCAAGFVLFGGLAVGRHLGDARIGALVTLMVGVATPVVLNASQVQSDIPFAALAWAVVLVYDRDGPWTWWRATAVAALGGAAVLFRTIGVALLPAVFAAAVAGRRRTGAKPFLPVVVWAAGAVALVGLYPVAGPFVRLFHYHYVVRGVGDLLADNIFRYRYLLSDAALHPLTGAASDIYHLAAFALALLGAFVWFRRRPTAFGVIFPATFGAALLLLPLSESRYGISLLPFIAACVLAGAQRVLSATRLPARRISAMVTMGVCVATGLHLSRAEVRQRQWAFASVPAVVELFRNVAAADAAAPGQRLLFVRPLIATLATRVPAMPLLAANPDSVLAELDRRGITLVVAGDLNLMALGNLSLRRTIMRHPERFVHEYRNESFELFRVVPARGAGPSR